MGSGANFIASSLLVGTMAGSVAGYYLLYSDKILFSWNRQEYTSLLTKDIGNFNSWCIGDDWVNHTLINDQDRVLIKLSDIYWKRLNLENTDLLIIKVSCTQALWGMILSELYMIPKYKKYIFQNIKKGRDIRITDEYFYSTLTLGLLNKKLKKIKNINLITKIKFKNNEIMNVIVYIK